MRLSAADCLRRGWSNLSANWELVVIQWLGSFLVLALLAVGVVLPLVVAGIDVFAVRGTEEVLRRLAAGLRPGLGMGLVAMAAVWLLTLLLHCFFQAGSFGILASGERQALPGARRHRLLFRTFSLRDFCGWGGSYVWRFLGVRVLLWTLAAALGMAVLSWLIFLGIGGGRWGAPAAFGIGCGGVLPLAFLALVLGLWFQVAQADLPREGSGVRAAARRGLRVLGRRLGAVTLLFALFLGIGAGLSIVFLPLAAAADSLLSEAPGWRALVRLILFLLQSLPSTLLTMVLAGSLVALVRSETLAEIRRKPEVQTA